MYPQTLESPLPSTHGHRCGAPRKSGTFAWKKNELLPTKLEFADDFTPSFAQVCEWMELSLADEKELPSKLVTALLEKVPIMVLQDVARKRTKHHASCPGFRKLKLPQFRFEFVSRMLTGLSSTKM